ncbi:MAG: hypothetical protein REI64_13205 [Pedobacter sp.]|uniref:hypothetical protein n=1 Tax=Pedobacter sp. TaxID=1411316 RepID=UPI002809DA74|nr:hypothetical protein [Pedobacter sp.]MDQ8005756.1 hypothetical protein [Pedobacter sp.]
MKYRLTILLLLLLSTLSQSCKNETLINKSNWKYREGYYIGDWLDFKKGIILRNDTIFKDSIAIAKFIKISKGYLEFPTTLQIADLKTNEIGTYIAK